MIHTLPMRTRTPYPGGNQSLSQGLAKTEGKALSRRLHGALEIGTERWIVLREGSVAKGQRGK